MNFQSPKSWRSDLRSGEVARLEIQSEGNSFRLHPIRTEEEKINNLLLELE